MSCSMQVGTVGEVRIPPRSQWAGGPKKQHEAAVAQLSALPACHLLASLRHFAPLAAQAKLGSSHPPLMQQICRLATPTGAGGIMCGSASDAKDVLCHRPSGTYGHLAGERSRYKKNCSDT